MSLFYSTINEFNLKYNDFIVLSILLGLGLTAKLIIGVIIGSVFEIKNISLSHVFQQISTLNILGISSTPF